MAHNIPNGLKYTKEHEWIKLDNDILTIGITDFAQSSLGDIVFVELPEIGQILELGTVFGVVESIKSVSDLFSPISGEVIEINSTISDTPELLNSDPYDSGWMIKIKSSHPNELDGLLNDSKYLEFCKNSK